MVVMVGPRALGARRRPLAAIAVALVLALVAGCSGSNGDRGASVEQREPSDHQLERQGGDATVNVGGSQAFGQPLPGLDSGERRTFAVGNSFFNQNWVTAPSSTDGRDGLGPIFNAQSCSSCHFRDGRGRPPVDVDDAERGLLIRLSVPTPDGGSAPHPTFGFQFQDRSIVGIDPEGSFEITTTEKLGAYADGTPWSLAVPRYRLVAPDGTEIDTTGVQISPRVAPQMMGVGLLEAIPAEDITAAADPDDANDDGISGRANITLDPLTGKKALGRFGWKAVVPSVEVQSADAFVNDIGITSSINPDEPCAPGQQACQEVPDGGQPELSDRKLGQVTFYSRTLAVPARRQVSEPKNRKGEQVFDKIGCASCHTPEQRTGPSDVMALAHQDIRPYTDLLLHDLGPALADDRIDGTATGREWRTPPLWGIGLVETVNRHTRFLHDGRARNLEEAVLWHGGEAQPSQDRFQTLSAADRAALLSFLDSL